MPADVIRSIINKYTGPSANLEDLRLACICSIGLAGFFRYDELSNLAPAHLKFCSEYLRLFFPKAKNVFTGKEIMFMSRG